MVQPIQSGQNMGVTPYSMQSGFSPFQPTVQQSPFHQSGLALPRPIAQPSPSQFGGFVSFQAVTQLVNNILSSVLGTFERVIGTLVGKLTGQPTGSTNGIAGGTPTASPSVNGAAGATGAAETQSTDPITSANAPIQTAPTTFGQQIGSLFDGIGNIWNTGKEIFSTATDFFGGFLGGAKDMAKGVLGGVKNVAGGLWDGIKTVGSFLGLGKFAKVGGFLTSGLSKIGKLF